MEFLKHKTSRFLLNNAICCRCFLKKKNYTDMLPMFSKMRNILQTMLIANPYKHWLESGCIGLYIHPDLNPSAAKLYYINAIENLNPLAIGNSLDRGKVCNGIQYHIISISLWYWVLKLSFNHCEIVSQYSEHHRNISILSLGAPLTIVIHQLTTNWQRVILQNIILG